MATAQTNGADAEYFRATLPKIERLWNGFYVALVSQVLSIVPLFFLDRDENFPSPMAEMAIIGIVLLLAVTSWVYLVRLVLALKKRPIFWIGVAVLLAPIGNFIAAYCLNKIIREVRNTA